MPEVLGNICQGGRCHCTACGVTLWWFPLWLTPCKDHQWTLVSTNNSFYWYMIWVPWGQLLGLFILRPKSGIRLPSHPVMIQTFDYTTCSNLKCAHYLKNWHTGLLIYFQSWNLFIEVFWDPPWWPGHAQLGGGDPLKRFRCVHLWIFPKDVVLIILFGE